MNFKVGYYDTGEGTRRVQILDETISEKYVVRHFSIDIALDGHRYPDFEHIFLITKDKVKYIHEEEI